MNKKSTLKKLLWVALTLVVILNVIAAVHAYKFTHFSDDISDRTKRPEQLSTSEKLTTLFTGVNNPKPRNKELPSVPYEQIYLQSNKQIECWMLHTPEAKGTFIIFHGYIGSKSRMLDKAYAIQELGYNVLLVDFMGSGGSEGFQTTIGYKEAEQVKTCLEYLNQSGEEHIYLFGTSMGAVAIMKAFYDYNIQADGVIIECPFGSMYKTVCARFYSMNAPTFPMAGLLVFWGGVENGFWAFGHNPTKYAKSITSPTLLMYGAKDKRVSREEIDDIYAKLNTKKSLKIYPNAGHENYLKKYKAEWMNDISTFLKNQQ